MANFSVLDVFSGIGGLSKGFSSQGFKATGVDILERAGPVYEKFVSGEFLTLDLRNNMVRGNYDVLVGGPPCKPWAPVNLSRRTFKHRDYKLIERFALHVRSIMPEIFILENVPALRGDGYFSDRMKSLANLGYSIDTTLARYSDFGAPTSRKRLFAVGILRGSAEQFISGLTKLRAEPQLLRDTIKEFRYLPKGRPPDHVWPNLKTIAKYAEKYRTGKYGWRILDWDSPAPSFGNVMKTYILPPDSDPESPDARAVSVLEVSRIMGFNHGFSFPEGMHLGERYQMLVDSVSPVFSNVLAKHTLRYLNQYRF